MNLAKKDADEIREGWRSRALRESKSTDNLHKIVVAALRAENPGGLELLLRATFGQDWMPKPPFYMGYATVAPDGSIVCEIAEVRLGVTWRGSRMVCESEGQFIYALRKLADRLKLDDKDRTEMFTVLQKWVTSDKRVGLMGQRLAS